MFFEVLTLTYHSPITIAGLTKRALSSLRHIAVVPALDWMVLARVLDCWRRAEFGPFGEGRAGDDVVITPGWPPGARARPLGPSQAAPHPNAAQ